MKKISKTWYFWNHIRFYLSFALLAFYLIIGFLFVFTRTWIDFLPSGRVIIGTVIILFGILRFYIAYRRYSNKTIRLNEKYKAKPTESAD